MRQKAIGEGNKGSARETVMRAKVLAREMDGIKDRRRWQMIVWEKKEKRLRQGMQSSDCVGKITPGE